MASKYIMGSAFDTATDRLDAWVRAERLHELADVERRAANACGFGSDKAAAFDREARALRDAVRDFYATSKFSDPLAEVADDYIRDGFVQAEAGSVEFGGSHYALVILTEAPLSHRLVIVRSDSDGFVTTHAHGNAVDGSVQRLWTEIEFELNGDEEHDV